jgi:hypothetical protein
MSNGSVRRDEGALLVDGFVPLWFEPPTDTTVNHDGPPDILLGAAGEAEPLHPDDVKAHRYRAWFRSDVLANRLESFDSEPELVLADLAQIVPLCVENGHQGRWMCWWIGMGQSLCWWMDGSVVHYGCRMLGGLSDPSLLEEELRSLLGVGGPVGWETAPVAVIGDDMLDRLDAIIATSGRVRVPFPLDPRWDAVPKRFLLAAAAVDRVGVLDLAIDGPQARDDRDRAVAIRFALFGIAVCVGIAMGIAGTSVASWRLDRANRQAATRLAPEQAWLDELDSLSARGSMRSIPASRYLSEVSRCVPDEGRIVDWKAMPGDPRRHSILLEVANEASKARFGTCIGSSRLFEAPAALSTEVRWGVGRKGGNAVTVLWDVPEERR